MLMRQSMVHSKLDITQPAIVFFFFVEMLVFLRTTSNCVYYCSHEEAIALTAQINTSLYWYESLSCLCEHLIFNGLGTLNDTVFRKRYVKCATHHTSMCDVQWQWWKGKDSQNQTDTTVKLRIWNMLGVGQCWF